MQPNAIARRSSGGGREARSRPAQTVLACPDTPFPEGLPADGAAGRRRGPFSREGAQQSLHTLAQRRFVDQPSLGPLRLGVLHLQRAPLPGAWWKTVPRVLSPAKGEQGTADRRYLGREVLHVGR